MTIWVFGRAHKLRTARRLVVPLLFCATTSCAYFNTFYHAKQFYGQGEKARATERGQLTGNSTSSNFYKQAIQKCEKVIQKYPGSKWEDDAYLMLAKSHYWRGDYLSAADALSSLLSLKKTDLRDQGLFWQGRTALAQENYSEAQAVWQTLLQEYPKFKQREEVEYYKAQATWDAGDPVGAIGAYQALLKRYPKGDHAALARLDLGRLLVDERRYEEAEEVFTYVAQKGKVEEDRIEAKMQLGDVLEKQARYEEALELYTDLEVSLDANARKNRMGWEERQELERLEQERLDQAYADSLRQAAIDAQTGDPMAGLPGDPNFDANNPDPNNPGMDPNFPGLNQNSSTVRPKTSSNQTRRDVNDPRQKNLAQVLIREGCVLANLEKTDEAMSAFQQVVAEFPQSPFAAEAQYRIGYTYEVHLEQFDRAQYAYDMVERQGNSSFRDDAVRRSKNLVALKTLMATAAKDSLSLARSAEAESRFMKAELYLFQQENIERAVEEYTSIETAFKGSEHAAKAGLALAWIAEHERGDSAAARTKYAEVASQYPDTEYGRRAHAAVYGPEPEPEPLDFAGPSLDELTTPENQEAAWRQAGGDSADASAPSLAGMEGVSPNGSPNPSPNAQAGDGMPSPAPSGATPISTASGALPGIGIAGAPPSNGNPLPDSLHMASEVSGPLDSTQVAMPGNTPDGPSVAATSPNQVSAPTPNEMPGGPSAPGLSSAGSAGAATSAVGGAAAGAASGTGTVGAGAGAVGAGAVGAGAGATLSDMVKATRQPPTNSAQPDSVAVEPDSSKSAAAPPASSASSTPSTTVPAVTAPIALPGGLYLDPLAVPADGPSPVTPSRKPRPRPVATPQEKTQENSGKASKSGETSGKNASKKNKTGSSEKNSKKGASPDSTSGTGSR